MIEVQNVSIRYGKHLVLNDLSLAIQSGELMVLVGASGVGKSTLLRLIAGLEKPSSGKVWLNGREQSRIPPHQRDVAFVFQSGNGYEHLTVRENLKLAKALQKSKATLSADELAITFGLDSLLEQRLSELSGGQAQRAAIARAVLTAKRILLMDEPLAHLDEPNRESLRQLIRKCHRDHGTTTVYVTHDSEEALSLSDRIAVMHEGKIVQVGLPQEIYDHPVSPYVAKQFGRNPMSLVRLPRHWLEPFSSNGEESILCGIRSHWWNWLGNSSSNSEPTLGFSCDSSKSIVLVGRILSAVWLGDRCQVELDVPSKWKQSSLFVSVPVVHKELMRDNAVVRLQVATDQVHRIAS